MLIDGFWLIITGESYKSYQEFVQGELAVFALPDAQSGSLGEGYPRKFGESVDELVDYLCVVVLVLLLHDHLGWACLLLQLLSLGLDLGLVEYSFLEHAFRVGVSGAAQQAKHVLEVTDRIIGG